MIIFRTLINSQIYNIFNPFANLNPFFRDYFFKESCIITFPIIMRKTSLLLEKRINIYYISIFNNSINISSFLLTN